tara:strand:+ start:90 stop:815 length:726 start_codon:yes stop_codon:yes gene_type:complete
LDPEDVVVSGEHVHGGGRGGGSLDSNLGIINAGEVASAGRLVLLGLEGERIGVHTGAGVTGVMVVRLNLVEVLTLLFLEAVLTVKDELEGIKGTDSLLGEKLGGVRRGEEGGAKVGDGHVAVGLNSDGGVGLEDDSISGRVGEVPETFPVGGVGEAPHKLLHGVVVGEADLLLGSGLNGVRTSVLDLLDEVLVALLGKTTTFLGVKVDVVGPDLEDIGIKVCTEVRREVNINAYLMILQGN